MWFVSAGGYWGGGQVELYSRELYKLKDVPAGYSSKARNHWLQTAEDAHEGCSEGTHNHKQHNGVNS